MTALGALVARVVVAAIFLYAGISKATDPAGFAQAIQNYRLLPYPAATALAVYLPWLEIICALGLFFDRARLGALAILGGLCATFVIAIASAWARGLDISCGCFGSSSKASSGSLAIALLRGAALGVLCVWLFARERLARNDKAG